MSNKTSMPAVGVIPEHREVRLVDHAVPQIQHDNEVKVRSLEVGVCGTDKEICTFVYGSPPPRNNYLVLGHESLGEVVEVGAAVSDLKPGDLVVPSVRRPCPHPECQPCRAGMQDFCSTGDFTERGIKMRHGYMTEYYVDEDRYFNRVPSELREVGVLVEPLTIAEKAIAQIWQVQKRLPWGNPQKGDGLPGKGLKAVVLGAGPVGILGAMALQSRGFETFVYSRSPKPNVKADLVESIGVTYISSKEQSVEQLLERVGNMDVVYEAIGVASVAFSVLEVLGTNGVFVFTGIPAPRQAIEVKADNTMRNLVLKNQVVVGTVNADGQAFRDAIEDLGRFRARWPDSLNLVITGRYSINDYEELLLGDKSGIKNVISLV